VGGYHGKEMSIDQRTTLIRRLAEEAGFEQVGIAPVQRPPHVEYLRDWLTRGCAGNMEYLYRHRELLEDPRHLLEGARSVIVVAHAYKPGPEAEEKFQAGDSAEGQSCGKVSRYAWGRDYHRVMRKKLKRMADVLREQVDEPFQSRVCVDTAPLLEREFAMLAGVGWIGKNTMVLNQRLGSYFFLGEIITTLELEPTGPATDHCGSCTRCLEACPTGALIGPYQMDASRCISYLTIENRGEIDEELQPLMGEWVYGCDICQEVCPFNHKASPGKDSDYQLKDDHPFLPRPKLSELKEISEDEYREYFQGQAIKRATPAMLRRNAAIALANAERAAKKTK
jgi:epoxyqueuosine reductase